MGRPSTPQKEGSRVGRRFEKKGEWKTDKAENQDQPPSKKSNQPNSRTRDNVLMCVWEKEPIYVMLLLFFLK